MRIIVPILVGALIGYCTNYIAIKMLFRPKKAVKIGSFTLPFTPGIIPKNKERIAAAVGNAISGELLTGEDLKKALLKSETKNAVIGTLVQTLDGIPASAIITDNLKDILSTRIVSAAKGLNLGEIIVREGTSAVKENLNGMLSMLISDKMLSSFATPIAVKIDNYIDKNGEQLVRPAIDRECADLENKSLLKLLERAGFDSNAMGVYYDKTIAEKAQTALSAINIAKIVEEKINAMDASEVEKLVMSVMKNELSAIVNLGAIIGAVIGVINILF